MSKKELVFFVTICTTTFVVVTVYDLVHDFGSRLRLQRTT